MMQVPLVLDAAYCINRRVQANWLMRGGSQARPPDPERALMEG